MNDGPMTIDRLGRPDRGAIEAIVHARHGDPFAVLGPHEVDGGIAVRCMLPDATAVAVIGQDDGQVIVGLEQVDGAGFWCGVMPSRLPYRLRVRYGDVVRDIHDPYAFGPALGELDIYLLSEGRHREIGQTLGAHIREQDGVRGCASRCGRRTRAAFRWSAASTGGTGAGCRCACTAAAASGRCSCPT